MTVYDNQSPESRIQLHGFNNLTKTLSFNIYDVCYACSELELRSYFSYINSEYSSKRLCGILSSVAAIIGARILNVATTDYEPHGASVTMMVAEGGPASADMDAASGPAPEAVVAHLDKSHLTVHTYPESHPSLGVSTFRADIDVSTCGRISPLKALNFLIHSFDSDIVHMDYRIRGFTRDLDGCKHYTDHAIDSIQDYLDEQTRAKFIMTDRNLHTEKIFHTRLMPRHFCLEEYLFDVKPAVLEKHYKESIEARLKKEMREIYDGRNA